MNLEQERRPRVLIRKRVDLDALEQLSNQPTTLAMTPQPQVYSQIGTSNQPNSPVRTKAEPAPRPQPNNTILSPSHSMHPVAPSANAQQPRGVPLNFVKSELMLNLVPKLLAPRPQFSNANNNNSNNSNSMNSNSNNSNSSNVSIDYAINNNSDNSNSSNATIGSGPPVTMSPQKLGFHFVLFSWMYLLFIDPFLLL
jgi:hypothetical protein